jgi:hypothetical protein
VYTWQQIAKGFISLLAGAALAALIILMGMPEVRADPAPIFSAGSQHAAFPRGSISLLGGGKNPSTN